MPYDCMTCDKKFRYKISLRTHKCTGFISNERTSTTTSAEAMATTTAAAETETSMSNEAVTFIDNDQQSMSSYQQLLDELITESYNRMGIVDHTDPNPTPNSNQIPSESLTIFANSNTQPNHQQSPSSSNQPFQCDSFNLNDLNFCTGEITNMDLANVIPSMNEIFPQSIEILNALYDNESANNTDLHQFYNSSPSQQ